MQSVYIKAGELLTKIIETIGPTYEMAVRMIWSGDSIDVPTVHVHLLLDHGFPAILGNMTEKVEQATRTFLAILFHFFLILWYLPVSFL